MTAILVDTTVIVDVLRRLPEALSYIQGLQHKPFVSVISIMEIYSGARSTSEEKRIEHLLRSSEILIVTERVAITAGQFTKHYRASHGIDDADALIAATAETHKLPLATLNVKHFPMFPKLKRAY